MKKPRKQARQEAILNASLKLFTERGYFNTSVSDIQRASKMSVGSLYNYFRNKESIAVTLLANIENCLYEALCEIERNHRTTHDRLKAAVHHMFETTERNADVMQYLLYTKHREFMPVEKTIFTSLPFQKMKEMVVKGQKNGEIRNITSDVAVVAIFGSAFRMISLHIDGNLPNKLSSYLEESWECAWRGVKV